MARSAPITTGRKSVAPPIGAEPCGRHGSFPDGALLKLAIPEHHEYPALMTVYSGGERRAKPK